MWSQCQDRILSFREVFTLVLPITVLCCRKRECKLNNRHKTFHKYIIEYNSYITRYIHDKNVCCKRKGIVLVKCITVTHYIYDQNSINDTHSNIRAFVPLNE